MTGLTKTNRIMVFDSTHCKRSTSSNTRIGTFLIYACKILGAFGIYHTFWSTTGWTTRILWQTWAHSLLINFSTLTVWSARRRLTWIHVLWDYGFNENITQLWIVYKAFFLCVKYLTFISHNVAVTIWVTTVSENTSTRRQMVHNLT